jgi:mTERF domain-containing protein
LYLAFDTVHDELASRFFSYSLDGRIIPRHKVLVERQINLKLRYMLASTDEEFEKKVDAMVERRRRFEAGLVDDDSLSDSLATEGPDLSGSGQYSKF